MPHQDPVERETDWAEEFVEDDARLISRTESNPDESGARTIVEIRYNDEGKKIKITKKVRSVKKVISMNPRIAERRKWPKFGICKDKIGSENGVTVIGDNVSLNLSSAKVRKNFDDAGSKEDSIIGLMKNALANKIARDKFGFDLEQAGGKSGAAAAAAAAAASSSGSSSGKYVAPRNRTGFTADPRARPDDEATVKVSNLPEDIQEGDLKDMFSACGRVSRVFLAKDRNTRLPRGFAYITFFSRHEAEKAIERMNRFLVNHMVLDVEWAQRLGAPR